MDKRQDIAERRLRELKDRGSLGTPYAKILADEVQVERKPKLPAFTRTW